MLISLQESPAILVPVYLTLTLNPDVSFTNWIILAMYMTHYANRSIIYPMRIRGGKATPIFIVFLAFAFTTCNGYMQVSIFLMPYEILTKPCLGGGVVW